MTIRSLLAAALVTSALAQPALAEIVARPSDRDPRIKNLVYREDDVIRLELVYGISTMILFGEGETVETISSGDSEGINAEPSKDLSILFVKPVADGLATNLSVTTNRRNYVFYLTAKELNGDDPTFKVRILYPGDERARRLEEAETSRRAAVRAEAQSRTANPNIKQLSKADVNLDYGFKGSGENRPELVFDDGRKTYFKFTSDIPAIFTVDRSRNESLVNHRREGDYIVVDGVKTQWTLRDGDEVTCLFNMAVPDPGEGLVSPLAPKDLNRPSFFRNPTRRERRT